VIEVSVIAAKSAGNKPGSISGDVPIAGTNRVLKDASIIVTVSGSTVGAERASSA
jgi:hypothetical protein